MPGLGSQTVTVAEGADEWTPQRRVDVIRARHDDAFVGVDAEHLALTQSWLVARGGNGENTRVVRVTDQGRDALRLHLRLPDDALTAG
ncbi:hypothetical protein GCM10027074_19800 [Streptomyces deserti]